jgi:hypothetical protein
MLDPGAGGARFAREQATTPAAPYAEGVKLLDALPPDAVKLALVLAFSFLVGLQREEHRASDVPRAFGGVRTFPLIGMFGYGLAVIGGQSLLPVSFGTLVIGALMLMSYYRKFSQGTGVGITSELSGLLTYLVGGLVAYGHLWVAAVLFVMCLLLLELKDALEGLARSVSPEEISAAIKFALLAAVLLPLVPNEPFTRFELNPFKISLVVVAVSGISFFSYTLQKLTQSKSGVLLSAVLGGAYSSTATTVALARRAANEGEPHVFAGSIVTASGVMYVRLALLLALFNIGLMGRLAVARGWGGRGSDLAPHDPKQRGLRETRSKCGPPSCSRRSLWA